MKYILDDKPTAAIELANDFKFKIFPLHYITKEGFCSCGYSDCSSPGKHPRTKNGLLNASNALKDVEGWWTGKNTYSNIGIATGKASGIVVLDIDGPEGNESLAKLIEEQGEVLPPTLTATTGKGLHFYFKIDDAIPVRNSASKLGKGIDVRGNGGYVVAPPSNHVSGRKYTWVNAEREPAYCPGWLLDLMVEENKDENYYVPVRKPSYTMAGETHPYGRAALEAIYRDISNCPEGGRNELLNKKSYIVGGYVPHLITYDDAMDTLTNAAINCGLVGREIGKTIESGLNKGMSVPRYPNLNGDERVDKLPEPLQTQDTSRGIALLKLSDVQKEKSDFFWGYRLPLGEISILSGSGGHGKSFITMSIAAAVTSGTRLPDNKGKLLRGNAVFVTYEDSLTKTLVTRAESLGIDPDKFYVVDGTNAFGEGYDMFGANHVQQLTNQIREIGDVRLIVIDPLGSFLGATDGNSETQVRALMAPLVKCAHETNACVVIVAHHKKGGHEGLSGTSAQMISGSQAVGAYSRSVLQVAEDDEHRKYLIHSKHNLSAKQDPLEYSIVGDGDGLPVFEWIGVADITEADLFRKSTPKDQQAKSMDAADFLCGVLKNGPMTEQDINTHARNSKVNRAELIMASKRLGIVVKQQGGTNTWRLPDSLQFRPKYKLKT